MCLVRAGTVSCLNRRVIAAVAKEFMLLRRPIAQIDFSSLALPLLTHRHQPLQVMFGIFGRLNPFGGGGEDNACDMDAPPSSSSLLATAAPQDMAIATIKTEEREEELALYEEGMRLLVELRAVLRLGEKVEEEELAVPVPVDAKAMITGALLQKQAQRLRPVLRKSGGGSAREYAIRVAASAQQQGKEGDDENSSMQGVKLRNTNHNVGASKHDQREGHEQKQEDEAQPEPSQEEAAAVEDDQDHDTQPGKKRAGSGSLPRALACLHSTIITSPDLQAVKLRKTRRRSQEVETENKASNASVGPATASTTTKTPAKRARSSKAGGAGEGGGSQVKPQVHSPPNHSFSSMASPEPARRTRGSTTRSSARRSARGSLV